MPYTLEQEREWKKTISQAARAKGMLAPEVLERSGKWYEKYFFQYFNPHVKKDNSKTVVLDAGCGTGSISQKLQSLGFQVHGVDFSEDVISLARQNAPKVHFETASVYELPFSSAMFDIVLCLGLFQTVGDVPKALQEMYRVLKPDGVLVIRTLNSFSVGSLFLSKDTMRFSSPFEFSRLARDFGFKSVSLKGVYVFPWFFHIATKAMLASRLFALLNAFFSPLFVFFSHSFYLEARK